MKLSQCLVLILIFTAFSIISCSKDDATRDSNSTIPDITVLSGSINGIIQSNISADASITDFNLTEELGLTNNSILMNAKKYDPLIAFYQYNGTPSGGYSIWEKNIDTQETLILNSFCDLNPTETGFFPRTSANYLTMFVAIPSGPFALLQLNVYNKNTRNCELINLGQASTILHSRNRIVYDDSIVIYHLNERDQSVITKIDLENAIIQNQLIIDNISSATVNNDELHVFTSYSEFDHYVYNLNTFELLESANVNLNLYFETGLFETSFHGNSMLTNIAYAQPSPLVTYPAIVDFDTNTITNFGDLFEIRSNLQAQFPDLGLNLSSSYTVDLTQNLIIGSYTTNSSFNLIENGIYYADFSGDILSFLNFDLEPSSIIIR